MVRSPVRLRPNGRLPVGEVDGRIVAMRRREPRRTTTAVATTSPAARFTRNTAAWVSAVPCCATTCTTSGSGRDARRRAGSLRVEIERRLESWAFESQARRSRLLASEGFEVVRWFFEMLRPNLDDIADMPMPTGLRSGRSSRRTTARSGRPTSRRFATTGARPRSRKRRSALLRPARVPARAVARGLGRRRGRRRGHEPVLTTFNEQTGERRGLLAGVSVRRPWRRRGLARALVASRCAPSATWG